MAVGVLIVMTLASALWTSVAGATTRALNATQPVAPFGVYAGAGDPTAVASVGEAIGRQPAYAMDFLDGTTWQSISDPSWFASQWAGKGYDMIWGVPILPGTGGPYSLATGATGAYNQYFVTLAQRLVADGQGSAILRLGWEFNGGWFPWAANGQATAFVAYWQQIVGAMRSVPGADFKFEWNPTRGDLGVGNLADYYPGDNYVDIVGLDVYDTEWANYPGASAEFIQMEDQSYGLNWLAAFAAAHNKAMSFPEWGLGWGPSNDSGPVSDPNRQVSGGDDPTFVNDMSQWISSHDVMEATFWDYGSSSIANGQNPLTMAALKADFGPSPQVPTTTVLRISAPKDADGDESGVELTVSVTPTAKGVVRIATPATNLCDVTLQGGAGSCHVGEGQLNPGRYDAVANFLGTALAAPSSSQVHALWIAHRSDGGAALSDLVHMTAAFVGRPSGSFFVRAGSTRLCAMARSMGADLCSFRRRHADAGAGTLIRTHPVAARPTTDPRSPKGNRA